MKRSELAKKFNISANTVKSTLKACGLPVRDEYTEDEVERFTKARSLFEEGKTRKEVAAHFGVTVDEPVKKQDVPTTSHGTELLEALGKGGVEIGTAAAEVIANELVPLMPYLVAKAFNERARNGAISKAFSEYTKSHILGHSGFSGEVVEIDSHGLPGDVNEEWGKDEGNRFE